MIVFTTNGWKPRTDGHYTCHMKYGKWKFLLKKNAVFIHVPKRGFWSSKHVPCVSVPHQAVPPCMNTSALMRLNHNLRNVQTDACSLFSMSLLDSLSGDKKHARLHIQQDGIDTFARGILDLTLRFVCSLIKHHISSRVGDCPLSLIFTHNFEGCFWLFL